LKVFIPMLAAHAGIADRQLLEQDVRLHLLLRDLTRGPPFDDRLVFKGGTCLIKCYLDYPRFSVDLDFTWLTTAATQRLGSKKLRRSLRPSQRSLAARLQRHAMRENLLFDPVHDVTYGYSNRMMTATLRYESVERLKGAIKVQVNFDEPLQFPVARLRANGLLAGEQPAGMALVDSDLPSRYAEGIALSGYDAREIVAEKGRALLTRQAAKSRDLVDLFLLETRLGLPINRHLEAIEAKTRRAVERAARYREHLELAESRFDFLREEDIRPLLLKPIPMRAYEAFRSRALEALEGVAQKIRSDLPDGVSKGRRR
jgi:predicted nucleotidyltransferase component of viral defense system